MRNYLLSFFFFSQTLFAQDLSAIYEKVSPAVVIILTEEKKIATSEEKSNYTHDAGLGSGFMISDKEIITAAHVVSVAEKINVQFHDGEVIPAKVTSSFQGADVALIELLWARKNPKTVELADSDNVRIGEQIFIVGAPYGLVHSLSSGYVSGRKKIEQTIKNPFSQMEYLQTDASINQGNSGGPMFNLDGKVVGIVSQILSESGGFQGIGFAATSNMARKLLLENSILWSGMDSYPITGKLAKAFNLPQAHGLLVQRVVFLSPFGTLGLQGGDIETIINGKNLVIGGDIILSIGDIKFEMTDKTLVKIGEYASQISQEDPLKISVLRGGKVITLERK
ncbi:MAG: trypsin-like peptidase domain-containing protein [Cyclobacteriaceae bacterium]